MQVADTEIPSTVVPDPAVLADAAVSAATDSPVPEQSEPRQPCCTDNGNATDAATDVNGTCTYTGDDAPDDASAGAMDAANDTGMVATTDDPGTPNVTVTDETEAQLVEDIKFLRAKQSIAAGAAKLTRQELSQVKAELAAKLWNLKNALETRIGRGGKWRKYLKEHDVPVSLATADRMVAKHAAKLGESPTPVEEKLLNEELYSPTKAEVDKYADKLLPKLGAFLTTQEAAYQFMAALALGISTVEMECCDKGLVLIAPNAAV
jgi:hypothetical protein